MDAIISMLKQYLEKYSSNHIENNSIEEFNIIFVEVYDNDSSFEYSLNGVLLHIKFLIINSVIFEDGKKILIPMKKNMNLQKLSFKF